MLSAAKHLPRQGTPTEGALLAQSICKTFPTPTRDLVILRDISFSLSPGESAAIMGPSGSGKSTLLNILGTLEPPTSGTMILNGVDPFSLGQRELAQFRNGQVGFIFQEHHLLPQCTAIENVLIPSLANHNSNGDENLTRAMQLLDRVGLKERGDHRPAELSGGERQRVAIARSLINRPTLLLADEPTGNLDRKTADEIVSLLLEIHRELQTVLVLVTHSESVAERMSRQWKLDDGRLTDSPSPS